MAAGAGITGMAQAGAWDTAGVGITGTVLIMADTTEAITAEDGTIGMETDITEATTLMEEEEIMKTAFVAVVIQDQMLPEEEITIQEEELITLAEEEAQAQLIPLEM